MVSGIRTQQVVYARNMKEALPSAELLEYHQLYDLLDETWHYGASNPRDKLYSKLALFTDPCHEELQPSYTKDDSEVFSSLSTFLRANCDCRDRRLLSLLSVAAIATASSRSSAVLSGKSSKVSSA